MFENNQSKIKYADIIEKPRHISAKRPHMSVHDRAAQFSPFAALTGHDDAVRETARLTDERIELDENEISIINEQLIDLVNHIENHPVVSIMYFVKDTRKEGGAYITATGSIYRFDQNRNMIIMEDKTEIPVKEIIKIKKL